MYCKNKNIIVGGMKYNDDERKVEKINFNCIVTNDSIGKTLSIDDGHIQYTIPFEPLQKFLK